VALSDPSTRRLGYRPELDGIRALAVVAVMLFHSRQYLGRFHYTGGHFGVDVFFVLSGFLITTLLDQERRRGRIDLRAFYVRRALRLLPALFIALTFGGVVAWRLGSNVGARTYPFAALVVLLYVGNWFQIGKGLGLLTSTWSLGVEEQYYLIWPNVLRFARRVRKPNLVMAAIVAGAIAIALVRWRVYESGHTGFGDNSTLTRSDGVLWGSALALAFSAENPRFVAFFDRGTTPLVGASLVIGLTIGRLPGKANYLTLTLINLGAALVIGHLAVRRGGICARVLSVQPLPVVGRISYGLYLFHFPMNYLIHGYPTRWTGAMSVLATFGATFALATASFMLVERPALRLKSRFEPAMSPRNLP
jgi:peptidoglycan/LPS O-acetylase OafA/YrhL